MVSLRLATIGEELEHHYYCYSSEAQQYVPPGHAFYLLNPLQGASKDSNGEVFAGKLDTLITHASSEDYSFSKYNFRMDTRVNLKLLFEFVPVHDKRSKTELSDEENYVLNLYQNYLIGDDGSRLVDTAQLDSLIALYIQSEDAATACGYELIYKDEVVHRTSFDKNWGVIGEPQNLYRSDLLPRIKLKLYVKSPAWALASNSLYFYLACLGLTILVGLMFIRNNHALHRMKEVNRAKSEFIHMMTHEFNTPVTNLALTVENFSPDLPTEKLNRLMTIVGHETDRIRRNLRTLFQISKLEVDEVKLNLQPHSMHQLVAQALEVFELSSEQTQIMRNFKAANDVVRCDDVHMLNVITNIVENGIKYSGEKSPIHVSTRNEDRWFVLEIRDEGFGMSLQQIEQAFDKYYRSDDLRVQSNSGFGLGLFYCKKIVVLHDGQISAKSILDKGTTVFIKIPLKSA